MDRDAQGKSFLDYLFELDLCLLLVRVKNRGVQEAAEFIERKARNMAISKAPLLEIPYNFRDDAQVFLEEKRKGMVLKKNVVQPDANADKSNGELEVIYDEKLGPYDLLMTKVDIKHGVYG